MYNLMQILYDKYGMTSCSVIRMKNPVSVFQVYSYIRCHDHDQKRKLVQLIKFRPFLLLGDGSQLSDTRNSKQL